MNYNDYILTSGFYILGFGILGILILLSHGFQKTWNYSYFVLALTAYGFYYLYEEGVKSIQNLWILDDTTFGLSFLLTLLIFPTLIFMKFKIKEQGLRREDYKEAPILILLSFAGVLTLIGANHGLSLFIGIQMLSIPNYVLMGASFNKNKYETSHGLRYLLASGIFTALLLFGLGFIYFETGTLDFSKLVGISAQGYYELGLAFVVLGIAGKLSLAPMHFWVADVYEKTSYEVLSYISGVAKMVLLIPLIRLIASVPDLITLNYFYPVLTAFTCLTLIGAPILALKEKSSAIKRLVAYSSMANVAFMLILLLSSGFITEFKSTVVMPYVFTTYFTVYLLSTLTVLLSLSYLEVKNNKLALVSLSIGLLSLMGTPLTAGFWAKIMVLKQLAVESQFKLVLVLIASIGLSIVLYIKLLREVFLKWNAPDAIFSIKKAADLVLILLSFSLLLKGIIF